MSSFVRRVIYDLKDGIGDLRSASAREARPVENHQGVGRPPAWDSQEDSLQPPERLQKQQDIKEGLEDVQILSSMLKAHCSPI